jgi:hypothetical protein
MESATRDRQGIPGRNTNFRLWQGRTGLMMKSGFVTGWMIATALGLMETRGQGHAVEESPDSVGRGGG